MKSMYRTFFGSKIEKYEIVRDTKMFVSFMFNGNLVKEAKKTNDWQNWFDNFDDARTFLMNRESNYIEDLKIKLHDHQAHLEGLIDMKPF